MLLNETITVNNVLCDVSDSL